MVGVLGPNGAGKTTTMLLLATLLSPSRGTARRCTKKGDEPRNRSIHRRLTLPIKEVPHLLVGLSCTVDLSLTMKSLLADVLTRCNYGIMVLAVRTAVTLDGDVERLLRNEAHRRGKSLKVVLNEGLFAFFTKVTTRPVEVAIHSLGKPPSCAGSCLGSLFCPVPRWRVRRKRAEKVAGDCCDLNNGSKERSFVGFRRLVEAADLSHEL